MVFIVCVHATFLVPIYVNLRAHLVTNFLSLSIEFSFASCNTFCPCAFASQGTSRSEKYPSMLSSFCAAIRRLPPANMPFETLLAPQRLLSRCNLGQCQVSGGLGLFHFQGIQAVWLKLLHIFDLFVK
jgi:hypothetical protein